MRESITTCHPPNPVLSPRTRQMPPRVGPPRPPERATENPLRRPPRLLPMPQQSRLTLPARPTHYQLPTPHSLQLIKRREYRDLSPPGSRTLAPNATNAPPKRSATTPGTRNRKPAAATRFSKTSELISTQRPADRLSVRLNTSANSPTQQFEPAATTHSHRHAHAQLR